MKFFFIVLIAILLSSSVCAQTSATTNDGRKVTLNNDGTYTWDKTEKKTVKENEDGEYFIAKHVDDMTNKIYYYSNEKLICQDRVKGQGFSMSYDFKGKTDNTIKISGLILKIVGLKCLENTELLFLFDDNSKLSIKSWNEFNCKGNAWFNLSTSQKKKLASKVINKIRVQNGRNFKTYTQKLENEDKSYLISA